MQHETSNGSRDDGADKAAKPFRPCAVAVDAPNRSMHLRRTCEKGYRMQHETSNDSRDDGADRAALDVCS